MGQGNYAATGAMAQGQTLGATDALTAAAKGTPNAETATAKETSNAGTVGEVACVQGVMEAGSYTSF